MADGFAAEAVFFACRFVHPFFSFYLLTLYCKSDTMAQTTVSIRMDNDLKNSFDHICNELGMSMSTAVTMLAKKMTREQRLPFELSVDPFYSEQNQARLRKSIAEMEATGGTIHEVNLND